MSHRDKTIIEGIAKFLNLRGVAIYGTPYPTDPDLPPIYYGMLPDKPDLAVALNRLFRIQSA